MTTFKVGGPADLFVEPRSSEEIVMALRLAHAHGVPVTMLGGGSNVLVADAGIRGLVLVRAVATSSARTTRACAPMPR